VTDTTTYHLNSDALQTELLEAKQRLAELRRKKKLADLERAKQRRQLSGEPEKPHTKAHPPETSAESDYAFGARAIARVTGQTPQQVYYWHRMQMYGDAVWAAGPKSLVGSIPKLRNLGPRT
jgi:hypothetical protein